MEKLKKIEAFKRAVASFGEWRTWSRSEHIAYGLIRGIPYSAMERYAHDNVDHHRITVKLLQLGAWGEMEPGARPSYEQARAHLDEVAAAVVWVRSPVRPKRERPQRAEFVPALAE